MSKDQQIKELKEVIAKLLDKINNLEWRIGEMEEREQPPSTSAPRVLEEGAVYMVDGNPSICVEDEGGSEYCFADRDGSCDVYHVTQVGDLIVHADGTYPEDKDNES